MNDQVIDKFTIYHIPGRKVGCTKNLVGREILENKLNGHDNYLLSAEVLEIVEGTPQQAGDREWYWADLLGYSRGCHYTVSMIGLKSVNEVHSKNRSGPYSKDARERAVRTLRLTNKGLGNPQVHKDRVASQRVRKYGVFTEDRVSCPHCNKSGQPMAMKRWHFDNCKDK